MKGFSGFGHGLSRTQQLRRGIVVARCSSQNGTLSQDSVSNGMHIAGERVENVVIVGSGPAGYTAAIYAGRANLKPVVFEGVVAGGSRGGQLMTTTEVENFPGFPEGITGPDLMDKMRAQAERWGSELHFEDVEEVDLSQRPFVVRNSERELRTHALIIATGATARRLNLPSEDMFWSKGISACAICDGASPGFRNRDLAVVGGGDSATEEALYLTKYGRHVHLLVRSDRLRASGTMQDRVKRHPRITIHYNTIIKDVYGNSMEMQGLEIKTSGDEKPKKLRVKGLFYGIGHRPNSDLVKGKVRLNDEGYVQVNEKCQTSVEGVFAAGDIHDTIWRQAVTAAGAGCKAAIATERYLAAKSLLTEFHVEQQSAQQKASEAAATTTPTDVAGLPEDFDMAATRFRGQYCLRKLYHESEKPIMVFYQQPSCGPCRSLKPMVAKVLDEFEGQVQMVDIDILEDPDIAEAGGITGTPTIQVFHRKDKVATLPGVRMKREYRTVLEKCLKQETADVAS